MTATQFLLLIVLVAAIAASANAAKINCRSWRLAVETNNLIKWPTVPMECGKYVANYMLGHQYKDDVNYMVDVAWTSAQSVNLTGTGKPIWVYDIDDTTLSNLPYYAEHGFGTLPYNATSYNEWEAQGIAPPIRGVLKLYNNLLSIGIRAVFMSGKPDFRLEVVKKNLMNAGYQSIDRLYLKGGNFTGKPTGLMKESLRTMLVNEGYRIVGNIGDHWSDITGNNAGERTFKVPDPMYYV